PIASPEEVLVCLSASQAQEYGLAKWSLAQRTRRHSDAAVERALADGRILRTHVLRPTWHFVLPEDILLAAGADRAAGAAHERVGLPPARAGRRGAVPVPDGDRARARGRRPSHAPGAGRSAGRGRDPGQWNPARAHRDAPGAGGRGVQRRAARQAADVRAAGGSGAAGAASRAG